MDKFPKDPRIILAGAVGSTRCILQALLRNKMNVVAVFGLSGEAAKGVSGYTRLDDLAHQYKIPYFDFSNINDAATVEEIKGFKPDLLFAVGFSQLVKPTLLAIPTYGCIGFHPTRLPQGRGRAPIAWLILEGVNGAATFFLMDAEADSGPILAQEPYPVLPTDYAADVIVSMENAIDISLDRWLPELKQGVWLPLPQDASKATYYGKRTPADGLIDWKQPARKIHALIRAVSCPHPGAFTFIEGAKMIIWQAEPAFDLPYKGVPGRILLAYKTKGWLVQTGDGLLWLTEIEFDSASGKDGLKLLKVGNQLGMSYEDEIFQLQQKITKLEEKTSRVKGNHP